MQIFLFHCNECSSMRRSLSAKQSNGAFNNELKKYSRGVTCEVEGGTSEVPPSTSNTERSTFYTELSVFYTELSM